MTDALLQRDLLDELRRISAEPGGEDVWPVRQLGRMAAAGVLGWVIPEEFGGGEISPDELTLGYERLAAADLTSTFVLTQRNGACQRIAGSENEALKAELLPTLGRGEMFATVGISHLTTSRQHVRQPAVAARPTESGFVLTGTVPWVTGAPHADFIVTGGTCPDGRQILITLPTDLPGVARREPPPLLALNGSRTGSVDLHEVAVPAHYLIAGPVEQVMKSGQGGGAGSLTTSALAIGTAAAALARLQSEAERRPDLAMIHQSLDAERSDLRADLESVLAGQSAGASPSASVESIRQRANSLALRSTQALLAASKGAGFVKGHPAERLVREAMFFLVWSCPQPVLAAQLREFACVLGE